jgi:hypothetical protein
MLMSNDDTLECLDVPSLSRLLGFRARLIMLNEVWICESRHALFTIMQLYPLKRGKHGMLDEGPRN